MDLYLVLCARQDGSGAWQRMDTCIGMTESLHCSHETVTTLLIDYTLVQNVWVFLKKSKKKKGYWIGSHSILQGIFLTQRSNLGLPQRVGHGSLSTQ